MRSFTGGVVCLLGLGLAFGCGSSDDSELGSGKNIPMEDVPKLLSEAACSAFQSCWGDYSNLVFGGEDCQQRLETQLNDGIDTLKQAKEQGNAKYDGEKAQGCIDAVGTAGCDIDGALESDACRAAFDGLIELGNGCNSNIECKGDAFCKANAACPGTCTAGGGAGDACQRDNECKTGFYCSDTDKKCTKPAAAGDVCGGSTAPSCDDGLFCLGEDDSGKSGNCRSFEEVFTAQVGEPCNPEGPFCATSARCGIMATTPTLELECIAPFASGAACRLAFPEACPTGEYCKVVPDTLEGTCTALPTAGQACAIHPLDQNELCAPATRCEAGMCKGLQSLGGTCALDTTCYSEFCLNGSCAAEGSCG
jgi:hypothetical protein